VRPVRPGHVAVRPNPRDRKRWAVITNGPVRPYYFAFDPQSGLWWREFVSRDVALYTAHMIIKEGWLLFCGAQHPRRNEICCLLDTGHLQNGDGHHQSALYIWPDPAWEAEVQGNSFLFQRQQRHQ
jgi:hypothetical protein